MLNEKALFIGPHGENRDDFTKWMTLLLEDVVQWKRNFHPGDPHLISQSDRRQPSFLETSDSITTAFDQFLGEMKQSVPFHSPRFLGHMHADLAMPALLGYITGLLYNQNNVVGESSPVSTRMEIEFIRRMCQMVGYKAFELLPVPGDLRSWGHLCSGGTTANLEAMWVARNLKYYPLSVKLLVHDQVEFAAINTIQLTVGGQDIQLSDTSCWQLFNLNNQQILQLKDDIIKVLCGSGQSISDITKRFEKAVTEYTVQHLGVTGVHQAVLDYYDEALKLPMLYVSHAGHYSWEKNLDILGLGKKNVCRVNVDRKFRLDIEQLTTQIANRPDQAILMVVGVVGTTEEGAIDPIEALATMNSQDKGFYFHIDGAYGGYFCSMVAESAQPVINESLNELYESILPEIEADLLAVGLSHSIAIDPHKLGYVPYAAGTILFADTRYKDFIYKGAPYLATSTIGRDPIELTYLGGWTLEGSRPGASAVSCALTSQVIPLDKRGHGLLMAKTIVLTKELRRTFDEDQTEGLKIIPIYEPLSNILCFAVTFPEYIRKPEYMNLLTKAVIAQMSISPERTLSDYQFITSKTSLKYEHYRPALNQVFVQADIIADDTLTPEGTTDDFELEFLRTVVMNPMVEGYKVNVWNEKAKKAIPTLLFNAFVESIHKAAQKSLPSILFKIMQDRKVKSKLAAEARIKVLWVENEDAFKRYKEILELDIMPGLPAIGKYLDIMFYDYTNQLTGLRSILDSQRFDLAVIDLNLTDNTHDEYDSGLVVVEALSTFNPEIKQVIFSQFMNPDSERGKQVRGRIDRDFANTFTHAYQLQGKSGDVQRDIFELTKVIFRMMQDF